MSREQDLHLVVRLITQQIDERMIGKPFNTLTREYCINNINRYLPDIQRNRFSSWVQDFTTEELYPYVHAEVIVYYNRRHNTSYSMPTNMSSTIVSK